MTDDTIVCACVLCACVCVCALIAYVKTADGEIAGGTQLERVGSGVALSAELIIPHARLHAKEAMLKTREQH